MGGMSGEIKGTSKIEVFLKYTEMIEGSAFLQHNPDPKYKKECKRLMEWDPEAGEWVLHYHLSF